MGKNQFLFIAANKMFLMIIDKGEDTIISTSWKEFNQQHATSQTKQYKMV